MRRRLVLAALVLLAAGVRLAAIGITHATHAPAEENRLIARHLAAGRGFTFTEFGVTGPTAVRGPAYPMLLAALGPDRVGLMLAINVLAGAASVAAAFALMRRLTRRPDAAWVAATVLAVWPTQVYAATLTQGLTLAVLLTLVALAVALRRTPPTLLAGGAIAGVAVLTEPLLTLPLALVGGAIGGRRRWPDAAAYLAAGLVVVMPWLYRNSVIFGRPMPITSNGWRDAFVGMSPQTAGRALLGLPSGTRPPITRRPPFDALPAQAFDRLKVPESQRVVVFRQWALAAARARPAAYAWACAKRIAVTLFFDPTARYDAAGLRPSAPSAATTYVTSRTLAASGLVVFAFRTLWPWRRRGRSGSARRATAFGPFAGVIVALVGGLLLAVAPTLAEMRNGVLMDVPQLLALALLCVRCRAAVVS